VKRRFVLYFVVFRRQISAQVVAAEFQRFVNQVECWWQPFPSFSFCRRSSWEKSPLENTYDWELK